jgi:hypothetical protein
MNGANPVRASFIGVAKRTGLFVSNAIPDGKPLTLFLELL